MKRLLFVCGYDDAWTQVSEGIKPSQHMFGLHEMIDRIYQCNNYRWLNSIGRAGKEVFDLEYLTEIIKNKINEVIS